MAAPPRIEVPVDDGGSSEEAEIVGTLYIFLSCVSAMSRKAVKVAIKEGRVSINGEAETDRKCLLRRGYKITVTDGDASTDYEFTGRPVVFNGEQIWPPLALHLPGEPDQGSSGQPLASPLVVSSSMSFVNLRLQQAASSSNMRGARVALRDPQCDIDCVDAWKRTPLMVACRRGNADVVAYLLSRNASMSIVDRTSLTPLSATASRAFDATSPSPGSATAFGSNSVGGADGSSLSWGSVMANMSIAELLLAHSHEPSSAEDGDTILHVLARGGNAALARLVLSIDAYSSLDYIARLNADGETASDIAFGEVATELRRALKAAVGPPPATADIPAAQLAAAIENGDIGLLRQYFRRQVDGGAEEPILLGDRQESMVGMAASIGQRNVVVYLLSKGAPATIKDRWGYTPLARAAQMGFVGIVRLLCSFGSVLEACVGDGDHNLNGNGVLHIATRSGNMDVVYLLCEFDVFRNKVADTNNQGQTPADLNQDQSFRQLFTDITSDPDDVHGVAVLPSPVADQVCAICLLPAPTEEDQMLHHCSCEAPYCEQCFIHAVSSAVKVGEEPICSNLSCGQKLPWEDHMTLLGVNQRITLVTYELNKGEHPRGTSQCPVCNRFGIHVDSFAVTSSRAQCTHCGVNTCAVCSMLYPLSCEKDDLVHAECQDKFMSLRLAQAFEKRLNFVAQRRCPQCGNAGIKDDACTHMSCCTSWCFVCGVNSSHGANSTDFINDPSGCPMYLPTLAHVDPRVAAIGCPDRTCRPSGSCTLPDTECRYPRDRRASALLTEMRSRIYILRVAENIGMAKFHDFVKMYGWKDYLDAQYFNNSFPWDASEVPEYWSFEPEECQAFYRDRLRWFDRDIPSVEDATRVDENDAGEGTSA